VLVTENVKDFAAERDIVIVCVLKSRLPQQGMEQYVAAMLDRWAVANPDRRSNKRGKRPLGTFRSGADAGRLLSVREHSAVIYVVDALVPALERWPPEDG
jgi:hypothetical protein